MKLLRNITIIAIIILISSCQKKQQEYANPNVDTDKLQKNSLSWWTYHNDFIDLNSEFIGINTNNEEIDKKSFLERLTSGLYIPVKLNSIPGKEYYKLIPLTEKNSIAITIKRESKHQLKLLSFEGNKIPDLSYTDLTGKKWNSQTTKNKIIVLKCWFIRCQPCVAEIPKLNKLVHEYANRKDIEFLSIAFDPEQDLIEFLEKEQFDYATASVSKDYMLKTLNVNTFPTHFIIGKDGKILKVINDHKELKHYLKELI
ncbi:TlpA family protein disulfide reductase [Christiangramia aquimixticola]|uniref:TlpA family protein disulfide reductase n=1 Tax=Christiangramia aquimixticola TaxID=1697558 RepID=UPI003AA91477